MRTKHVNGPRANQAGLNDDSVVTVFPRNKNNNNRNKENTQKKRRKKNIVVRSAGMNRRLKKKTLYLCANLDWL